MSMFDQDMFQVPPPSSDPSSPSLPAGGFGTPFAPPPPPPPTEDPSARPAGRWGRLAGAVALCAVVSGGVAFTTVKLTESNSSNVSYVNTSDGKTQPVSSSSDIHSLLAKVEPAVAAIEISDGSTGTPTPIAAGSGVVISSDGLMLTNAHVVNATNADGSPLGKPVITAKMADGTVRSAKVLGSSTDYDIALLRLADTSNLHPIALADTSTLQVGDRVVAIGNALDLGDAPTVSTGIVSALNRKLQETSTNTLRGLIQTDAAINHGNSGGALVNMNGELIGINSAGIPDAQNIGFAISVGTIKPILDDLKAGKSVHVEVAYIGVNLSETPKGIVITKVQDGTPAQKAGIVKDDILTAINGTAVATENQLANVLQQLAPGTKVTVSVTRNGTPKKFELTLAVRPAN